MKKLLIANRGEIAVRIIRTCEALGIGSVAVYSEADRNALHVRSAREAFCIGPAAPEDSYLNIETILAAARAAGADAVHPGYGFLSENPDFAEAVTAAGLIWVGPAPGSMRSMSSKITAREIAAANDVPLLTGVALAPDDPVEVDAILAELPLPLLIKAAAGGGGIGMREVHDADRLAGEIEDARQHALRQFGSADLLLERLILDGRHVEVQVLGDQHDGLVHLFERDCSAQRRRQKLIEEAPAPDLPESLRSALHEAALRLARAVEYQGAGTVEFLVESDNFYFLEMNTRLQVEHGVTEAICDLDLVEWQLRIAKGERLSFRQADISRSGHAIEARVYAEHPEQQFLPATGSITCFDLDVAPGLRIDSGVDGSTEVGHHYDGLLCKLIAHGTDRASAAQRLSEALAALRVVGVQSNQRFLRALLSGEEWERVLCTTSVEGNLERFLAASRIDPRVLDCALAAATIWHFLSFPPAADRHPWPGAYQLPRQSTWAEARWRRTLDWRWSSADHFVMTDLGFTAVLLTHAPHEPWEFEFDGERRRYEIDGDAVSVRIWEPAIGSLTLSYETSAERGGAEGSVNDCVSHGPGTVLKLLIAEGDAVQAGDDLVVVESMKMESTLTAGRSGRVRRLAVSEGELIVSGQLLVQLDDGEEQDA